MRKITPLLLLLVNTLMFAQFSQTNGPAGANFRSVVENNNEIFTLTARNNVFRKSGSNWERLSMPTNGLTGLAEFQNNLFGIGYNGLSYLNESTNSWEIKVSGYSSGYSISENNFFVFFDDTVYNSHDGITWTQTFDSLTSRVDFNGDTLSQRLLNITSIAVHDSNYVMACFGEISATQTGIYVSNDNGKTWYEPTGMQVFSSVRKVIYFNGAFYLASGSGLYRSEDNGASWEKFHNGFEFNSSEFISELIVQNGQLFASVNSPSELFKLSGDTWEQVNGITGFYYLDKVGENKISILYSDKLELFNTDNNNIEEFGDDLIASNCFVLAVDENVAFGYTVNKKTDFTTDGGITWNDFPTKVKDIIQIGEEVVYSDENGITKSNFDGTNAINLNANLPANYTASISAIHYSNGNLFVAFNRVRARDHLSPVWEAGGIYLSSDMGKTWTKSSSGLPTVASITVPVLDFWILDDMIIASTNEGIYRSINGGVSWNKFEQNLPQYGNLYSSMNYGDKMIFNIYKNIIYTTPTMNEWKTMNTGIDTFGYGFSYKFANENGKHYLFDNEEKVFYLLKDTAWEKQSGTLPEEFEVINFSSAGGTIYASVVDGGVWKGNINSATDVRENIESPSFFKLMQNYPNPFNPSTVIQYSIPAVDALSGVEAQHVTIIIYDILGNEVAILVNENQTAGNYEVEFNPSNLSGSGEGLASGVYIYRISIQNFTQSKKMLFLK